MLCYYIKRTSEKQFKEVSKEDYIRAEHTAGLCAQNMNSIATFYFEGKEYEGFARHEVRPTA